MSDDLTQAFQQFQAGLQSLQASRVLTQANEAVTQVRNSELDDQQKTQQLRVLGQQMAFGLASQGVSSAQIETLAGTFMPAKPTAIQSIDQAMISDDAATRERGNVAFKQKAKAEAEERALAQEAVDKRQQRTFDQQKKLFEARTDLQDEDKIRTEMVNFRTKVAKTNFEALDKVNSARETLSTDSAAAMGVVSRMIVGLSGDARVSDQDAEAVSPNPDLASKAMRAIKRTLAGKPLEADQEELSVIIDAVERAQQRSLKGKAQGFAKSRKGILRGMDENEFHSRLLVDAGFTGEVGNTPQPQAPLTMNPTSAAPPSPAGTAPVSGQRNKFFKPIGK